MNSVEIYIYGGSCKYDNLIVDKNSISSKNLEIANYACTNSIKKVKIDGVLLHYFLRNLLTCESCRKNFYSYFIQNNIYKIKFFMQPTRYDLIDHNWNAKLSILVRLKCELDHVLSWLSTLGGAFSALGDYFVNMAHTAGKISIWQLHLAYCLDDPNIMSRCKLYYSLSLIQRKRFNYARRLIRNEYDSAINNTIRDHRLINMCLGIWSKLQYEKKVFIESRSKLK